MALLAAGRIETRPGPAFVVPGALLAPHRAIVGVVTVKPLGCLRPSCGCPAPAAADLPSGAGRSAFCSSGRQPCRPSAQARSDGDSG